MGGKINPSSFLPFLVVITILDQVRADLDLREGEVNVIIPDMPTAAPQNLPVLVAQANQAQGGDLAKTRVLGVCFAAPNNPANYSLENVMSPVAAAAFYISQFEHRTIAGPVVVTILRQPEYGVLRLVTEADRWKLLGSSSGPIDPSDPGYAYMPESGYVGTDRATILVEIGGIKIKQEIFLRAVNGVLGNAGSSPYCSPKGMFWKISGTLDAEGNSVITGVDYQLRTKQNKGDRFIFQSPVA